METGGPDTDDFLRYQSDAGMLVDAGLHAACEKIVAIAVMIMGADMGSMQRFDGATGTLKTCAVRGFDIDVISSFGDISPASPTPCGRALAQGRRIVVTDIYSSNICDETSLSLLRSSGVMAIQSTPIMSRNGAIIGMISTGWRNAHQPSWHALSLMDRVAQQAADMLEVPWSGQEDAAVRHGAASCDAMMLDLLCAESAARGRLEQAVHDSETRLQRVLQAGEVVSYEWDCCSDVVICSSNCDSILGLDMSWISSSYRAWEARIHPEDQPRFREAVKRLKSGCGRLVVSYRYVRPDGGVMWLEDSCVGEYRDDDRLVRVCGLMRDVTARKRIEELQQLLMREFDHRSRNMLAAIQAMISLTARTQTQIGDFVIAVQSRIRSMARAHELIAGSRWTGTSLRDIVACELEPYTADRPGIASIVGKDEILTPGATMAVAMALHELVTNAAKYGALSTAEGRIQLQFHRDEDDALVLEWRESGGPEVAPPRRRGFGSLLIEGSMRTEISGCAEVRYLRSGLVCIMNIPAAEIVSRTDSAARPPEARRSEGAGESVVAGSRILLVEYPAASGLETRRRLESFGYQVLGPASTMEEAVRLADAMEFEAAIIDINFGEQNVFPVLDILTMRNVPIAFVTAYRLLRLPPRYRDCLVLTKPLSQESVRRMFDAGLAASLQLQS